MICTRLDGDAFDGSSHYRQQKQKSAMRGGVFVASLFRDWRGCVIRVKKDRQCVSLEC
jgi:hypothetical protein